MKTSCPQCRTVLTLQVEQLKQRNGMVRCGVCRHVFNAVENLQDEDDYPVLTEDEVTIPEVQAQDNRQNIAVEAYSLRAREAQASTDVYRMNARPQATSIGSQEPKPLEQEPVSHHQPVYHDDEYYISDERMSHEDEQSFTIRSDMEDSVEEDYPPYQRSGSGFKWFIASLLALLLIIMQLMYIFRNQLVLFFPSMQTPLVQMCSLVGCELGYQRSIDDIALENVSLSTDDKKTPQAGRQALLLQANLKNMRQYDVPLPSLVLSLKDEQNMVRNSKIIEPAHYAKEGASKPLAKGETLAIYLPFVLQGEPVKNYEVNIFYP